MRKWVTPRGPATATKSLSRLFRDSRRLTAVLGCIIFRRSFSKSFMCNCGGGFKWVEEDDDVDATHGSVHVSACDFVSQQYGSTMAPPCAPPHSPNIIPSACPCETQSSWGHWTWLGSPHASSSSSVNTVRLLYNDVRIRTRHRARAAHPSCLCHQDCCWSTNLQAAVMRVACVCISCCLLFQGIAMQNVMRSNAESKEITQLLGGRLHAFLYCAAPPRCPSSQPRTHAADPPARLLGTLCCWSLVCTSFRIDCERVVVRGWGYHTTTSWRTITMWSHHT